MTAGRNKPRALRRIASAGGTAPETPEEACEPARALTLRNIAFLQQALDLLADLPEACFRDTVGPAEAGSIGAHMRHILDHYDCLLSGWRRGIVDYDARARSPRTETEPAFATQRLRSTIARLEALRDEADARALEVRMDCGGSEADSASAARSTVARELVFLLSHTVHHFALVAVILRCAGREPPPDFGVAPSTVAHRQALAREGGK